MKRLFCLFLALLLAGCAPASSTAPGSESAPAAEEAGALVMANEAVNGTGYFAYYYDPAHYEAGTRLVRWDFSDRTMHFACAVPDCDHTGEACEAQLSGYPITVLADAVYTLERGADDTAYSLYVREADGTHPAPVGTTGYWFFCGADEKYLYGFCDGAFGRVSRTDGTETYLAHGLQEDFSDYGRILGVWQDRFVAANWDIDKEQPARICFLDRDGNVTEAAQVEANHFSDYSCVLIGSEVFYLDIPTGDVMAVNADTGETRTVTQALRPYNALEAENFYKCQRWYLQKVQDRALVRVVDVTGSTMENTVYRVNEDGTVTELPQRQELRGFDPEQDGDSYVYYATSSRPDPVVLLGEWNDQLVVLRAFEFFSYEGPDGPARTTRDVYALTDAADYLAGKENYREFSLPEGEV